MIYLTIVLIAILGLFGYREYQNFKERDDLLRKIMAKSYTEYTVYEDQRNINNSKKVEEINPVKPDVYVNPEEMTEIDQERVINEPPK